MKIKINQVIDGALFDKTIWDYWIKATLPNKVSVDIFDYKAMDLRKYLYSSVDALIKALFIEKDNKKGLLSLEGIIKKSKNDYIFSSEDGLEIFLNQSDILEKNLETDIRGIYSFGRLDLEEYNEIS